MTKYTIGQIENAINFWRSRERPQPDNGILTLSAPTRALVEPYARMIVDRRETIDDIELTAEQREALGVVSGNG